MTQLIAFFPTTGPVAAKQQAPVEVAPVVTQQVTVEQVPSRTDLAREESQWSWQELRDYVVAQIIAKHGPFPRDAKKEFGIFSRYLRDHGQAGIAVAKAAFEMYDGYWRGAPISINRFSKGSDPYFVEPILARLTETGAWK